MFGAEADAFREVWEQLAGAAALVAPPPHGVWLYGSSARGEDRPGSDIDIVVVSDQPREAADRFRMTLRPLEEGSGLSVAVVGLDLADIARLAAGHDPWWDTLLRDAKLLAGALPSAVLDRALAAPVRA